MNKYASSKKVQKEVDKFKKNSYQFCSHGPSVGSSSTRSNRCVRQIHKRSRTWCVSLCGDKRRCWWIPPRRRQILGGACIDCSQPIIEWVDQLLVFDEIPCENQQVHSKCITKLRSGQNSVIGISSRIRIIYIVIYKKQIML